MIFFRKRTIFHIEDNAPEEEELKRRFRRRVLFLGCVFFLTLTSAPLFSSLMVDFHSMEQIRRVAQMIQHVREVSMTERTLVRLEWFPEHQEWGLYRLGPQQECAGEVRGPPEPYANQGLQWKFRLKLASGEAVEANSICFHPLLGLLLGNHPVGNGTLLLTALLTQSPNLEAGYLLLGDHGAELQMLTHWTSRRASL